MTCVLDASMALSFVLRDEYSDAAADTLTVVGHKGAVVPTLWDYEVANGLRSAERRGRLSAAASQQALHGLMLLPIERRAPHDVMRILSLAREARLSAYDAAYLDLCIHLGLPLASADGQLTSAAQTLGVNLLDSRA